MGDWREWNSEAEAFYCWMKHSTDWINHINSKSKFINSIFYLLQSVIGVGTPSTYLHSGIGIAHKFQNWIDPMSGSNTIIQTDKLEVCILITSQRQCDYCSYFMGCLCGLVGSVLDHRSLPPEFESRCGHICRVFHIWLRFITFGGHLAHLAYHVHKVAVKHQSSSCSYLKFLTCIIGEWSAHIRRSYINTLACSELHQTCWKRWITSFKG